MKVCQACGREFEDNVVFCPLDGHELSQKPPAEPSAVDDALVGTILDEKYRLEKKIGEGGMGAVYRATHVHMDSSVAVKLLHKSMVADQQAVERFRREARAAARIRHANAVSVTDFGVTKEGTVYLVMEYLEGHDLREKLRLAKVMGPEETVKVMIQTCAAIEEAHRKGIVHRDLKPDNIWLLRREGSDDELVKVLDFGIAKLKTSGGASNLTQQGMIVGTPHYMSPEQCRGEELDARSDIYSLGVILYEMLTGDVPFRAPTPVAVVLKHVNEQPRPLHELNPSVPAPLEAVVMRSLSKDREARQASAAELARDLVDALRASGASTTALRDLQGGTIAGIPAPFGSTGAHARTTGTTPSADTGSMSHSTAAGMAPMTGGSPRLSGAAPAVGATQVMASDVSAHSDRTAAPTSRTITSPAPDTGSNAKIFVVLGIAVLVLVGAAIAGYLMLRSEPVANTNEVANTNTSDPVPVGPKIPEGMVLITGASFKMGTDDPSAYEEWKPAHEVAVKDFLIDETEVTNEQYAAFVRQTRHPAPSHWPNGQMPPGEAKLPVYNVTWFDAKSYAEWLGRRLPTEAEWELAARGTDGRRYPWGNDWSAQRSNSKEDGRAKPVAVGSYSAGVSPYGVHDMAGNVAELVADDFNPYPGSKAEEQPGLKVYRGGAYNLGKEDLVVSNRFADYPTQKFPFLGFRTAKDATP